MKFLHEYRDGNAVSRLADEIGRTVTKPWSLMEVCGGQTHSIVRYGIDQLLPDQLTLIHGPGCPVCVTPLDMIDRAIEIASRPGVIFTSFGDMLRVPGSDRDLLSVKASGGDVRIVYSPLDAVAIAEENPDREVVFFAVGFETTAPANAMAVFQAFEKGLETFSVLVSQVLVPPAIESLMQSPDTRIDGFLAAGHVCAIMGIEEYLPVAERYHVPIVVAGFEPVDLMQGILQCVRQLEAGEHRVENAYARTVRSSGNPAAQDLMRKVFAITNRNWRGLGAITDSGLSLRPPYDRFDAITRFDVAGIAPEEPRDCLSGKVLQGLIKPTDCPAFGTRCTPEHPLGATMVSGEGACAAYYRYRPDVVA